MSEAERIISGPREIDVAAWVEQVRADPVAHQQRQAAELVLNAVAMIPVHGQRLYLKGGILMGLAYESPRQTTDVDLTAAFDMQESTPDEIRNAIDAALEKARVRLGYDLLLARVQKVERRPKKNVQRSFPALKITVGYAERGSTQAKRLAQKLASSVISIDISFNETTYGVQILELSGGHSLLAYSLIDLVAEKYRAMLQQVTRNRIRRQDTYDLHRLIDAGELTEVDLKALCETLVAKCRDREITATATSLDDPEVRRRSEAEWETLRAEVDILPAFDECFDVVADFYRRLPW